MQLFNHGLINYLECTLSINAAKTVLIIQELGHFKMPVDQKSGILLFRFIEVHLSSDRGRAACFRPLATQHNSENSEVSFLLSFPQTAAPARTWRTWATVSRTGSNCSTGTPSRITPASSGRALAQVSISPRAPVNSVPATRRGGRCFSPASPGQEPRSQLQGLHRLDVFQAGHQQRSVSGPVRADGHQPGQVRGLHQTLL